MQTSAPFLDRVLPALDLTADRFGTLVSAAPDPTVRVAHSAEWTVRDVAAHLVTVAARFAHGPQGHGTWVPTPDELGGLNRSQIAALTGTTTDVGELAARLRQRLAELKAQIQGYGAQVPTFRFHGGEMVRADVALGILLGELVVHGYDVARTLRQPWPIHPGHAALIVEGCNPILPGWVKPERVQGLNAGFEVRLRGQATHLWVFRNGRLHVNPADPGPVDVHISSQPAALLLVLYSRQSQWRHIAAGRMLAWGRKPWLALTLTSRFHKP